MALPERAGSSGICAGDERRDGEAARCRHSRLIGCFLLPDALAHDGDGRTGATGGEVAWGPQHSLAVSFADIRSMLAQQAAGYALERFHERGRRDRGGYSMSGCTWSSSPSIAGLPIVPSTLAHSWRTLACGDDQRNRRAPVACAGAPHRLFAAILDVQRPHRGESLGTLGRERNGAPGMDESRGGRALHSVRDAGTLRP